MKPSTIDEIIAVLEQIINESIRTGDRAGYFAALYYKVTCRVKTGIQNGEFEDGVRMEKLDVLFASRYLDAHTEWKNGGQPTLSWKTAFEATKRSSVLVLQQLLLGMNAHINLDLGIAAVEVAGGYSLEAIHKDFNAINTIISSLTYEVLNEITHVSPLLSLLGLHATNFTSILIQFSIDNARDGAWCFAEELIGQKGTAYVDCIKARDHGIQQLADQLVKEKGLIRFTIWLIHVFEWKTPSKIIKVLNEYKKQKLEYS
jgi:Family of unknown function (DUF5995)